MRKQAALVAVVLLAAVPLRVPAASASDDPATWDWSAIWSLLTWSGDTGTGSLDRYRSEVFSEVAVERNLTYRTAIDAETGASIELRLDVYSPAGDRLAARPVVVLLSPGAFMVGDRTMMEPFAERLARLGFVAVTADYRLRPGAGGFSESSDTTAAAAADARDDIEQAIIWIRSRSTRFRVDPDAIGVLGVSSGGIIANDLAHLPAPTRWRSWGSLTSSLSSGRPNAVAAIAGGFSPLTFGTGSIRDVSSTAPPTLAIHGTSDELLRHDTPVALCRAMAAKGRLCVLQSLDTDHVGTLMDANTHIDTATDFFADHLVRPELTLSFSSWTG